MSRAQALGRFLSEAVWRRLWCSLQGVPRCSAVAWMMSLTQAVFAALPCTECGAFDDLVACAEAHAND
eukprot:UN1885